MKRIIIGVTGASGCILSYYLLQALKKNHEIETHLVMSKSAIMTLQDESGLSYQDISNCADYVHENTAMGASISSGSFQTDGMIVLPCSMKTLSGIANAYDENLIVRAADVCLKENRRVVLVPREMPFNSIHIRNLKLCSDAGYVIMPPVFTFYNHPKTMEDQINHFIGKVLMQFGIPFESFKPWSGM